MFSKRTDLAVEAKQLWQDSAGKTTKLEGVEADEYEKDGCKVTCVRILDQKGSESLGKPIGNYITVELQDLAKDNDDTRMKSAGVIAEKLSEILRLTPDSSVLIVGLGNESITPDAVGPHAMASTMVTRHLVEKMPEVFGNMRRVAALSPGVLGTTGLESAEIIRGVAERSRPDCLIIIDALASMSLSRLCTTVQIADTGITPGSGVGNARQEISKNTLGIPVIAIGAPTVVDAATVAADLLEQAGITNVDLSPVQNLKNGMIVTPRDIDEKVSAISRVIGYAVNLSLHGDMSLPDMMQFLS